MSYKLYIGDTASKFVTFDNFKDAIGETVAGRVNVIGGKAEIREHIDPPVGLETQRQKWDNFTTGAAKYFMLAFESLDEAKAVQEQLDSSDLPLIFYRTHGSGDAP